MNTKYVFIAPYPEMADLAKEVCDELRLTGWSIDIGYNEDAIKVAKKYVAQGVKIIVSRGTTAAILSQHIDIPVINMGVSPYDIIPVLFKVGFKGKTIGVMGFPLSIYGIHILSATFNSKIVEIPVSSPSDIPGVIQQAKDDGIEIILGGTDSIKNATEAGLTGIMFTSGKGSIASAMQNAVEIIAARRLENIKSKQLHTILDFSYDGILVTNHNNDIILMNKTAQKMLNVERENVIGSSCYKILPFMNWDYLKDSENDHIGNLIKIGKNYLVYTAVPVITESEVMGTVISFQYANNIEHLESKVRQELHLNGHVASINFDDILTESPPMLKTIEQAKKYAPVDSTILITGETGTGKEMVAQSIHNASKRKNGPFVAINCASIPETLLESELFGYEDGAFTGAKKGGKKGYLELANRGTLFLDEIGEISPKLQSALLRVLQEREIIHVGGNKIIPINARIIAATHQNLQEACEEGRFRTDLFHRLNILRLIIPTLNERKEDIKILSKSLMIKKAQELSLLPAKLSPESIAIFNKYHWTGNVRELETVIERIIVLRSGQTIEPKDIFEIFKDKSFGRENITTNPNEFESSPNRLEETSCIQKKNDITASSIHSLTELERICIIDAIKKYDTNRDKICTVLGISKSTLWRRMKKYNL
ncbi:MAG: sigma 54-interacting transcriptional regulator [Clostridia bacterium]